MYHLFDNQLVLTTIVQMSPPKKLSTDLSSASKLLTVMKKEYERSGTEFKDSIEASTADSSLMFSYRFFVNKHAIPGGFIYAEMQKRSQGSVPMHCDCLIVAHKAFYDCEPRARLYDSYLRGKKWEDWEKPDLCFEEIEKLFDFIKSWDYHFQGDLTVFKGIYSEIFPFVWKMRTEKFEDLDLRDNELKKGIQRVFDKVANCCVIDRYESTDASKMLHTMLPDLFVMWDRGIRKGLLGDENEYSGEVYAYDFLPIVQRELHEAIETFSRIRSLDRSNAIELIRKSCNGKTLPKLADQYNYMSHTMTEDFCGYVEKESRRVDSQEYRILLERLNGIVTSRRSRPQLNREGLKLQRDFRELTRTLDMLKKKGMVTAQQWRDYSSSWRQFPQDRERIKKHLERLLKNEVHET